MMKISKCTSLLTPSKIDKALFKFLDIDRQKNILNFNYDKLNSLSKKNGLTTYTPSNSSLMKKTKMSTHLNSQLILIFYPSPKP